MKIIVDVKASAKENKVLEVGNNNFKISVKEPAKEGKANEAVIKLLAKHFDIPKSRISIVLGPKNRKKVIEIN